VIHFILVVLAISAFMLGLILVGGAILFLLAMLVLRFWGRDDDY
jgi:hypothetical protein